MAFDLFGQPTEAAMIKTGVLLAGGRGTRLAPQTEIHNKHLLPVYGPQGAVPMIWYPLHTLLASGCKRILVVSSQEHCGDIMEFLGDGKRFDCEIFYAIQDHNDPARPVGIASALRLVEGFVGNFGTFMVILGDNFYEEGFGEYFDAFCNNFQRDMLRSDDIGRNADKVAHIFLKDVHDPERFGVATVVDGKVTKIVEKPKQPESKYAVTGLYFFTHHVFSMIPKLQVSDRGELEISHINDWYVKNNTMASTILKGYWHDMGTVPSMLETQKWINDNDFRIETK